jgi:pyruvate dehydrogenase E2 component (dihydrolipoamide acetyltransferase)
MSAIHKLTMPKWGLSMEEGKVTAWLVDEGARIEPGMEVLEVETDKIANVIEANVSGILRRKLVQPEDVVPVSGLLGVVTEEDVSDAEIDAFVADFQANFVPPAAAEEDLSAQPEKLQAAGQTIRYLKRGEGGVPAILIHGFAGDLNNWLFSHEALAGRRAVYALDLPAHGESSKDIERGDLAEFALAVAAFMDAAGIKEAHLVGHSMGGGVALELARTSPERAKSLTLISSAGLGEEISGDYIEGFVSSRSRSELKPHLQRLFADPTLVTRQLIDDMLKYKRLDGVDEALRKIAETLFAGGRQTQVLRDELAALGIPTLVIWGEEDAIIPPTHAEDLPGSVRVHVLPGKGHMVQMEAASEVNRLVDDFLG